MWWIKDETPVAENSNASVNVTANNVIMTTMTPAQPNVTPNGSPNS